MFNIRSRPELEIVPRYYEPTIAEVVELDPPDILADLETDMPDLDELTARRIGKSVLTLQTGESGTPVVSDQDESQPALAKVIPLRP